MIWLTWRQFRFPALAVAALLGAVFVLLAVTGAAIADLFADFADLAPQDRLSLLDDTASSLYDVTGIAVLVVPGVIGVFWGVPLVARELEAGTHRLVWNQTVTRFRWLTTKLAVTGLAAGLAAGLLSIAVTWWSTPIDEAGALLDDENLISRIVPPVFSARGIVPFGYALFALVLGVTIGAVIRRTLVAMVVTAVVFTLVQVLVPTFVRPYLLPATETTVEITEETIRGISASDGEVIRLDVSAPAGSWVIANETVDANGDAVTDLPSVLDKCVPEPPGPGQSPGPAPVPQMSTCLAEMADQGYRQHVTYQPLSRFQGLQWMETGLYLLLTLLVGAFCYRYVRKGLS